MRTDLVSTPGSQARRGDSASMPPLTGILVARPPPAFEYWAREGLAIETGAGRTRRDPDGLAAPVQAFIRRG